ncbi:MAG: hypothetical protein R2860_06905 [Desulfobacterales bacterium]
MESLATPVVLIMGGRDARRWQKPDAPDRKKCPASCVTGEAAGKITSVFKDIVPVTDAADMAGAVKAAAQAAAPGDCVFCPPACSSFDMYESYAHRGEDFARAVNLLKRGAL